MRILKYLKTLSPFVTTLLLLCGAITVATISIGLMAEFLIVANYRPEEILAKLSPMLLPSLIGTIGLYQSQVIMKRNAKKDASDVFLRKDIFTQLKELKENESKMEKELSDMKERILKLEVLMQVK